MHLDLSADQEALRDAASRLYTKESHAERVREAEATGFDERLWSGLVQLGAVAMAVPEPRGGGGASLADAAVVVTEHGAHLGAAPLAESVVAARALAACGDTAGSWLTRVVDDGAVVVLAPRPAIDGAATLVPGAARADGVLVLAGDRLVVVSGGASRRRTTDLGAAGDVAVDDDALVLASGVDAIAVHARAVDELRVLHATALAALARSALGLGVRYATDREQFGVPIGSFQTIQHRLADASVAVEGATLLARDAVRALDADEQDAAARAAQASWFCGEVALDVAAWSLHVHGGYGFMLEYDVQLHLRRAKAWRAALGDPRRELEVIATRLWDDERPPRRSIDFRLDHDAEEFRREVRAFISAQLTTEIVERAHTTGTMHDWTFHRALCERGYLAAGWPEEVGGRGRSAVDTTTLMQELYYAGAPVDGMGIAAMVGATLLVCGNDEQKRDVLPRILRGEVVCCLGYSEPDAGSDVAAVQTRAARDGDEWVINGQKMFTTMAHEAAYVFLLCRTNTGVAKHKGLTMFLAPMDTPGIELTPVETLGGERTNITFYTDVRVPDSCRVGDVDGGWGVMHAALVYERNSANWGEPAGLVDRVAEWARSTVRADGSRPIDDAATRERLARHATELEVGRLLVYRSAFLAAAGAMPHVEGSMAKLWVSEAFTRAAADLSDLAGTDGLLRPGEPGAPLGGAIEHAWRHSLVTTIYGGSSEVQRGIIAERGLGLPRTR